MLKVKLAVALPQQVLLIPLQLPDGATVGDAIVMAGLRERYPGLFPLEGSTGIFGRPCELETLLRDGDRIEITRPLLADPKEARRRRAERRTQSGR